MFHSFLRNNELKTQLCAIWSIHSCHLSTQACAVPPSRIHLHRVACQEAAAETGKVRKCTSLTTFYVSTISGLVTSAFSFVTTLVRVPVISWPGLRLVL